MSNGHDTVYESGRNKALDDVMQLIRKMRTIRPGLGLLQQLVRELQNGASLSDCLMEIGSKAEQEIKD